MTTAFARALPLMLALFLAGLPFDGAAAPAAPTRCLQRPAFAHPASLLRLVEGLGRAADHPGASLCERPAARALGSSLAPPLLAGKGKPGWLIAWVCCISRWVYFIL
eukprot:CAMPEP_0206235786 /NCGR_PEP_ID=MMETSP0047_2-20121206/13349_1 /ASSEMBLY_ACC=CAM_ASM_000192 /TAXON_ID=195065 /ORGANISM="Chroomonas mesostigmatica_cf, Strain CCMP1168" /LENGTH=106 /DNA_ID=CAMNT_0053660041 /DNA_START=262 /DNA_END=579 /DNA_ORIENTATION=-